MSTRLSSVQVTSQVTQHPKLTDLLQSYTDIFEEPKGLPPTRDVKHNIDLLPTSSLNNGPIYKSLILESVELKRKIYHLVEDGLIYPSSIPYGSSILFVPKKDGSWWLCIDYRALNKITIKNRYPLPRIDELIDQLQGVWYFTKIDLKLGYHQVWVKLEDVWKITFKTQFGLFEWLVMLFGLTNSPTTFMRMINDILFPLLDDCIVAYIDDILTFSKTWEVHLWHVQLDLDLLHKHKL